MWVVGLINSENNNIRLEKIKNRDSETLKTIIEKFVGNGNFAITNAWIGWNFLSLLILDIYIMYIIMVDDKFVQGQDSISRIESDWA